MLEKHEAAVIVKELVSLDKLQEKRAVALSALFDKYKTCFSEPSAVGEAVSNGMADAPVSKENSCVTPVVYGSGASPAGNGNGGSEQLNIPQSWSVSVKKWMRKAFSSLFQIIGTLALNSASNPFTLVLDSLKRF
ncbi:uncharacterized protein LOC122017513 [Zingiber officinale]|nr:uncharacterized protein LOC122017513 [Zingiber officinale]